MKEVNLKDLVISLETGKRPKGGAISTGIPSLGGEHINVDGGFNLNEDKLKYVALEYFNDMTKGKIKEKDILIVKDGATTGKVAYVDDSFPLEQACINEHVFLIRVNSTVLPKYLFYYFYSPIGQKNILKDFRGATVGGISTGFIDMNIYLPSKDIQERTVKILDVAKQVMDKRKEQIKACDELIKSQFIEMFGSPATNPMGWKEGTIRDVVTEVKYGTSKPAQEGGQYTYLRMNNITYDGQLDLSNLKYIDMEDKELEKYIARKGDVLFNRTNSKELVGKTCVFNHDTPMIIAGYIIRVRTNELVLPEYLSAVLNSKYGKETLAGMCKAIVGQANINAQELQDIKICIPPIELQKEYVKLIQQVDKLKFEMQQSLVELENNFNSLIQTAFKGELF